MEIAPVTLITFNRPETTKRVLDAIRKVRPSKLFLVSDGPRDGIATDIERVKQTRAILNKVDWPCEAHRLYFETNQGCGKALPMGLDWAFQFVDSSIILEDDCLPGVDFFRFCSELLIQHKNENRIFSIGGHRNDGPDQIEGDSYFYSKYPSIWGWATWKNRWKDFDLEMKQWPTLSKSNWLRNILGEQKFELYWKRLFDKMNTDYHVWDYALFYSCWLNKKINIRSKVNLIENIGFGSDATHTKTEQERGFTREVGKILFPIVHPDEFIVDDQTEKRIEWVNYSGMTDRMLLNARTQLEKRREGKSI